MDLTRMKRIIESREAGEEKYNDLRLNQMITKRMETLKQQFKTDIWIENDVWFYECYETGEPKQVNLPKGKAKDQQDEINMLIKIRDCF